MSRRQTPSTAIKLGAALVMCITGFLLFMVTAPPNSALARLGTSGSGYDPLNAREQQVVLSAVHNDKAVTSLLNPAKGNTVTLLVERHQEDKTTMQRGDWQRRADTYIYDYASDTLIVSLVDVASGDVLSVEAVQGVQLPLIQAEIDRAFELALADAEVRADLNANYQSVYGVPLDDFDTLNYKAFIFRADAMPFDVTGETAACGIHRCAQLLIYTQDDVALDLLPIVNLSAETVTQSVRFEAVGDEK